MIITLRTDKPESEIGLYNGQQQALYVTWEAHRQLAETLHHKIAEVLQSAGKDWPDITGVVVFQGPGSFTGLRIGISVANALAYSYRLPIAGTTGEDWISAGIDQLLAGNGKPQIVPDYGAPPHITEQKK